MPTLLALSVGAPALADDRAKDAAKPEIEKKVCRFEARTGSALRKRTCLTAAQWQQLETAKSDDNHSQIDNIQSARALKYN
ncbi:hypothetical protein [Novosphingobium sp. BL-52-GroH]|uniref:hypothetical protein n=1 Tax=Novosphingobium sp. BL-52-GroH TaxID=3349877 RepID=UPI00384A8898